MVFPAHSIVYKLPKHLLSEEAVFVEPLSCAVHVCFATRGLRFALTAPARIARNLSNASPLMFSVRRF
jgi:hypothetical protein